MSRDNRCGPDGRGEIHGDPKKKKGMTNLERLSRDGCSFSLGSGVGLGNIMNDWVAIR